MSTPPTLPRNPSGYLDFDGIGPDNEEVCVKGFYFRPNSHICKHFMVSVDVKEQGENCEVAVYEVGIPQSGSGEVLLENGERIAVHLPDYVMKIGLWGKYYFPHFNPDGYQWYYNESNKTGRWEYDPDGNSDEVLAMAEVMKYAIANGLEIANIKPY
jgi:hypothetical protein